MKEKYKKEMGRINRCLENSIDQRYISYLKLQMHNLTLEMQNEELLERLASIESSKPIVMYCCDKHKKSILDKER